MYDILKKLCRRPSQETSGVSRRGAMRAGLALFTRHNRLFASLLVQVSGVLYIDPKTHPLTLPSGNNIFPLP